MLSDCIKIQLKEGREFVVSRKAAELSELLTGTMNDYPDNPVLPLTDVDDKTAEKVVEYLLHFNGVNPPEIEKPLPSGDLKSVTDEWSFNYVDKISLEDLVNITVAANFMGIQSLLDLCCAKLASMCKDKSEEDIFKMFNITETFTEEEKEKIRQENSWIEENI